MPVYGTPQSGPYKDSSKNLRVISPGDRLTLFDGTETPAEGLASVAFVRGPSVSKSQAFSTFMAVGMASDMVIDIQASNTNVDADYQTIGQLTSELASPPGFPYLTDSGSPTFYRAKITTYSTGDMPTLTVQR